MGMLEINISEGITYLSLLEPMSNGKRKEPISKVIEKSDNLPPLQQAIIMYLAGNDPQTIRGIAEAISKDYSNTHTAFKSLVSKKLVVKTAIKHYRKQDYIRYWLTDEGIILALMEGADANELLAQMKILYPDAVAAHIFLEVIPLFGPEILKLAYDYAKTKGKLEFVEVAQVILSGAASGMEIETGKKVALAIKRYPKYYNALKIVVQEMIKQLNYLIED